MNDMEKLYKQLENYLTEKPMSGSISDSAKIQELLERYYKFRVSQNPNYGK